MQLSVVNFDSRDVGSGIWLGATGDTYWAEIKCAIKSDRHVNVRQRNINCTILSGRAVIIIIVSWDDRIEIRGKKRILLSFFCALSLTSESSTQLYFFPITELTSAGSDNDPPLQKNLVNGEL